VSREGLPSGSACSLFFTERVVNIWKGLPVDTDFSSLQGYIRQINGMDFLELRCITSSF